MKKLLFITLIVIALAGTAYAENLSMALDPMYLGVGARPLGMGKSYVAVAEGADAILLNPAGLGSLNGPKATSMYTTLMNDATYTMIAGGMPVTESIGLGAGFVSVTVGDIDLYTAGGAPNGSASYSNGVAFISAGVNVEKDKFLSNLLPNGGKNLLLGVTAKLFMQNASGSDLVEAANGSGLNADIGLLYNPADWLSLGVNEENPLPTKIAFKEGVKEDLPMTTKLGSKVAVIGEKGLNKVPGQKLDVMMDLDMNLWGMAAHLGTEYKPINWLTLRAGIDQDSSPAGVQTNPTMGVGFTYGGFSFDYAYHPYGKVANDASHFFSISYIGEEKKEAKKKEEVSKPKTEEKTYSPASDYKIAPEYKTEAPKKETNSKDTKVTKKYDDDIKTKEKQVKKQYPDGVYALPDEYKNISTY